MNFNKFAVVEVENLGVRYKLYDQKTYSLKEAVIGGARQFFGQLFYRDPKKPGSSGVRDFWAIQNLNFKIYPGQCLALYGHNGSGKSTTLKVISGVLHPTVGSVCTRGRISALVELGAGFDPELTGRENILFGASLAGLSRKEALKRMDGIIDFTGLKDFIDVPVKNYSSGMYARLGFGVATDVDPDILVVDEILAVGDEEFQKRCLDRMIGFRKMGKTIIFVSHDRRTIDSFCDEVIEMSHGQITNHVKITKK